MRKVRDELNTLSAALGGFDADALTVDAAVDQAVVLFERASRFGLQQVGWGFLYEWRRRAFSEDAEPGAGRRCTRWQQRLGDFVAGFAAYEPAAGR